jgi:hypothetical protein
VRKQAMTSKNGRDLLAHRLRQFPLIFCRHFIIKRTLYKTTGYCSWAVFSLADSLTYPLRKRIV